ncbi:Protein-glucosylgalactosylhydroxylysine glucosidase [Triplophysa tibetana]|uniref:Protein-glucosylgalactosylhydroxylysine glucosidase n=1 Tax=Triplophysa tibetana TaxID=1572043 RepID=A0A5A9PVV2_9TELE|nr:Protein-glucosylgalactosylhydroxylysine glucosidase [Triplophysa tibetana]
MTSHPVDPYIFTSDTLPSDPRFMPPLTNGLLGWRVFDRIMHMGGVYNGEGGACHRADIPCPLAVQMKPDEVGSHMYKLDMRKGIFSHTVVTLHAKACQVLYTHRHHSNLMVMEVHLQRLEPSAQPITVHLDSFFNPQSDDITFRKAPDYKEGRHIFGQTNSSEVPGGIRPFVHMIWTPVSTSVTLPSDQRQTSWVFLVAVAETSESAQSNYNTGLELIATGDLCPSHLRSWTELWLGSSVEVVGPETLNRALIGCMFYLLSAFPSLDESAVPFGGVSPGGLSNGGKDEDYLGHVFWDQDTWMYPGISLFYPKLAQAVLQYRIRTIEGAHANAQQMGYKGLKFAWESAVTGRDVCPDDLIVQQEIHINGDVIMAFKHYFYLTQDLEMFKVGGGSEVVWGVADYWVSRVTWDPVNDEYHIKGVIPPDEYYTNVDNSVFTNAVAQSSLRFALELASHLSHTPPPEWQNIADKIKIPFDPELMYHPEFDGYTKGTDVKQADTVLLGYPLGVSTTPEVRRNDLEIYETVTDPLGPAMTWGMFAVGWLELGEAEKAQELLQKCFKNIQKPFQVWSESADGSGCVNFLTGMGGFLQAVLFGYTGFRVQKECLAFAPLLPQEVDALSVKGVCYLGNKMDWLVKRSEVSVTLRKPAEGSVNKEPDALTVVLNTGTTIPLKPGQSVTFSRQPGQIRKQISGSYCWPL